MAHGDSTAPAATPSTKETAGSLTSSPSQDAPAQPAVQPQAQPPVTEPWEKRYRDLQSRIDRDIQTWRTNYQTQGTRLQELEKFKREQDQRAQAASLKPWSKSHPEHSKFLSRAERVSMAENAERGLDPNLTPEARTAARNAIWATVPQDEIEQVNQFREHSREFQRNWITDPQGTLMPMVDQLVEQKIQQFQQRFQAQAEVARDFEDPKLKPLIEQYSTDFQKALEDQVPYEYAVHMLKMHAENQRLKAEHTSVGAKLESANERQRLAKGEAAITRDPRAPVVDPYEAARAEAAKRGFSTDHPQFASLLAKHSK